jgi:hypothetical protein
LRIHEALLARGPWPCTSVLFLLAAGVSSSYSSSLLLLLYPFQLMKVC